LSESMSRRPAVYRHGPLLAAATPAAVLGVSPVVDGVWLHAARARIATPVAIPRRVRVLSDVVMIGAPHPFNALARRNVRVRRRLPLAFQHGRLDSRSRVQQGSGCS